MLTIIRKKEDKLESIRLESIQANIPREFGWDVIEIHADGKELEYILAHFQNIPVAIGDTIRWERAKDEFGYSTGGSMYTKEPKKMMQWFGDHAKFIAYNL
jgi:hypothetical protein